MTEAGHVVEMFSRIALAHPEIHLTYRSGGKVVHDLPPVAGHPRADRDLLRPRAGRVAALGRGPARRHAALGLRRPPVAEPVDAPRGSSCSSAGRYVRDRSLSHALNEAYRGLLMVGRMPVAFLHLEIPPEEVDVNVHPTKVEVRFRDSQRVYSHLLSTLRQTFLKSDLHARLQAAQEPAAAEPAEVGAACRRDRRQPETRSGADSGFDAGLQPGAIRPGRRSDRPADGRLLVRAERSQAADSRIGRPAGAASVGQSLPLGFAVGPGERSTNSLAVATPGAGVLTEPSPGCRLSVGCENAIRSVQPPRARRREFRGAGRAVRPADRSREPGRTRDQPVAAVAASRPSPCSRRSRSMTAI